MTTIYSGFRSGKCIMQEIEWENLKCKRCGAKMPRYPSYDNKKKMKSRLVKSVGKHTF